MALDVNAFLEKWAHRNEYSGRIIRTKAKEMKADLEEMMYHHYKEGYEHCRLGSRQKPYGPLESARAKEDGRDER